MPLASRVRYRYGLLFRFSPFCVVDIQNQRNAIHMNRTTWFVFKIRQKFRRRAGMGDFNYGGPPRAWRVNSKRFKRSRNQI